MHRRTLVLGGALSALLAAGPARAGDATAPAPLQPCSAWVLAMDAKGAIVQDLKAEDWKVRAGGRDVVLKKALTPAQTGEGVQNWALVFEPVRDPAYRQQAFQAAAQFLSTLPEGDRVLVAARTKAGMVPLTAGLSTDRLSWVKALEQLPANLCGAEFEGKAGAMDPSLAALSLPAAAAPTAQEAFNAALQAFVGALPKAVNEGPYKQRDPKGVSPVERLGMGSPVQVTARLAVMSAEMRTLQAMMTALGKVRGAGHFIVFSRNDADDFNHPSVRMAATQRTGLLNGPVSPTPGGSPFARSNGDNGGPQESAELANRETKLAQGALRRAAQTSGVTLYSVAGSSVAFRGNLGSIAESTGGYAFVFDNALPERLAGGLQPFTARYLLEWEAPAGEPQELAVSAARKDLKLFFPAQR